MRIRAARARGAGCDQRRAVTRDTETRDALGRGRVGVV